MALGEPVVHPSAVVVSFSENAMTVSIAEWGVEEKLFFDKQEPVPRVAFEETQPELRLSRGAWGEEEILVRVFTVVKVAVTCKKPEKGLLALSVRLLGLSGE